MSTKDGDRKQNESEPVKRAVGRDLSAGSGGLELAFGPVVFALIGLWLDRRLGTIPLFVVGLTILGFIGAVANVYYRYKADMDSIEAETAALRAGTQQMQKEQG